MLPNIVTAPNGEHQTLNILRSLLFAWIFGGPNCPGNNYLILISFGGRSKQKYMATGVDRLIDPKVWEDLQNKIDDDTKTHDEIRDIVKELDKLGE